MGLGGEREPEPEPETDPAQEPAPEPLAIAIKLVAAVYRASPVTRACPASSTRRPDRRWALPRSLKVHPASVSNLLCLMPTDAYSDPRDALTHRSFSRAMEGAPAEQARRCRRRQRSACLRWIRAISCTGIWLCAPQSHAKPAKRSARSWSRRPPRGRLLSTAAGRGCCSWLSAARRRCRLLTRRWRRCTAIGSATTRWRRSRLSRTRHARNRCGCILKFPTALSDRSHASRTGAPPLGAWDIGSGAIPTLPRARPLLRPARKVRQHGGRAGRGLPADRATDA